MKEEDNSRLVEVFNGSRWEAELIKGLLESNDIEALLKDGLMTAIAPYISPTVSVMVNTGKKKQEDQEKTFVKVIHKENSFVSAVNRDEIGRAHV